MNDKEFRYVKLHFIVGVLAGAIGTIINLYIAEKSFPLLMIIYMGTYFGIIILLGIFRKFIPRPQSI